MELKALIGFATITDTNVVRDCFLSAPGTQCSIHTGYINDHVFSKTLCYSGKEMQSGLKKKQICQFPEIGLSGPVRQLLKLCRGSLGYESSCHYAKCVQEEGAPARAV